MSVQTADTAIFRDSEVDLRHRARWWTSRVAIYAALVFWAIVCLFPIYWTVTTSFKMAPNVMQGHLVPCGDECVCDMRADEPGAAGDEYLHVMV